MAKPNAAAALLLAALLSACAGTSSVRPGAGPSFVIEDRSYDEVWSAAIDAVTRNLTIVSQNKAAGEIRAEKAAGMATWGEVVGVFIAPPDRVARRFTVSVDSRTRFVAQVTGQDWSQNIIAVMQADLRM